MPRAGKRPRGVSDGDADYNHDHDCDEHCRQIMHAFVHHTGPHLQVPTPQVAPAPRSEAAPIRPVADATMSGANRALPVDVDLTLDSNSHGQSDSRESASEPASKKTVRHHLRPHSDDEWLWYHPHNCSEDCRAREHPNVEMCQPIASHRDPARAQPFYQDTPPDRRGDEAPQATSRQSNDEVHQSVEDHSVPPATELSARLTNAYDALLLGNKAQDPPLIEMLKSLDIETMRLILLGAASSSKRAREGIRIRYWQSVEAEEAKKAGEGFDVDALGGNSCFGVSTWPPPPLGAATKAEAARARKEENELREHFSYKNHRAEIPWGNRREPDKMTLMFELGYKFSNMGGWQGDAVKNLLDADPFRPSETRVRLRDLI